MTGAKDAAFTFVTSLGGGGCSLGNLLLPLRPNAYKVCGEQRPSCCDVCICLCVQGIVVLLDPGYQPYGISALTYEGSYGGVDSPFDLTFLSPNSGRLEDTATLGVVYLATPELQVLPPCSIVGELAWHAQQVLLKPA